MSFLFAGGSLAEFVEEHRRTGRHFSESELTNILYQVVQGLRYIHSQNLVHLDLKPGKCPSPEFLRILRKFIFKYPVFTVLEA